MNKQIKVANVSAEPGKKHEKIIKQFDELHL